MPARPARVRLLGLPLDVLDRVGLIDAVAALSSDPPPGGATVAYLNIHVANEAARHPALQRFLQGAELCYCDGEGVRLGARLLGHRLPARMTGADWIHDLAARAAADGWRIAWIGGAPGVTAAAAATLQRQNPGLSVHTEHGFHDKDGPANDALIDRVNAADPRIVLVGMGTPLQEQWVAQNRARLRAPVVWVLGATADFLSGAVPRGPAFLYNRQEWLARLLTDPRRLWRRYLVGNTLFMGRIVLSRYQSVDR